MDSSRHRTREDVPQPVHEVMTPGRHINIGYNDNESMMRRSGRIDDDSISCDGRIETQPFNFDVVKYYQQTISSLTEQLRRENQLRYKAESKVIELQDENKKLKKIIHLLEAQNKFADFGMSTGPLHSSHEVNQHNDSEAPTPISIKGERKDQMYNMDAPSLKSTLSEGNNKNDQSNMAEDRLLDLLEQSFKNFERFMDMIEPTVVVQNKNNVAASVEEPVTTQTHNVDLNSSSVLDAQQKNKIADRLRQMWTLTTQQQQSQHVQ
jgi:hypothetical protein